MNGENWKTVRLSTVLEKIIDYRGKAPPKAEDGIRLITARNVRFGYLDLSHVEFIDEAKYETWMNRGRPCGTDVLFTTEAPLANACIYPADGKFAVGQRIITLRPDPKKLDSNYLLNFLLSPFGQGLIDKRSSGTTAKGIKSKEFAKIEMPLPPLNEQWKVGTILATWDRAIETVGALIANARAQKQALMQQLLPQGTTPPKKRLLGFSGEWRKIHIGDVAKEVSERAGEKTGYPVLSCSKYDGMVESLSYFKKKVYSDDTSNYKVMRRGTFGFPSNHVEEGSIGYQDLCDAGIVSPIYCVFATSKEVDDGFLYKLLKTDRYRQIFAAATNASVDRRGSLRWKEFSRIPLPLPPLEEQRAISEAVDAVAATETAYQAQLTALRQEKAALMQQLLTGKRRVKLPENEAA